MNHILCYKVVCIANEQLVVWRSISIVTGNTHGMTTRSLQGKRYMVTFIISHYKHRVSLQHSVTLSTDTIEGINW